MPKVLKAFKDKHTGVTYKIGSEYEGTTSRISELVKKRFVEAPADPEPVEQDEFPKHVGGGYYELADGSKVRGKENAYKGSE